MGVVEARRHPRPTPTLTPVPVSALPVLLLPVIDADGLWLVAKQPGLVRGNPLVVLTPNAMEFARLEAGLSGASVEDAKPPRIPPNPDKVGGRQRPSEGQTTSSWPVSTLQCGSPGWQGWESISQTGKQTC